MKRLFTKVILAAALAAVLSGCSGKPKVPEDWYKETLQYYTDGFADNWANEISDLYVADEMKDSSNKFGYLLKDLDGDGTNEVLIGYMDDAGETRFIDLFIWHSDKGAFRIFHCGDDYYMYLCEDNIIRMDSWYGSATKTEYLKYKPENNSFLKISEASNPQKCELTAF